MYDVIRVTLDSYRDTVGMYHPFAHASGLSKYARNNSTKWHKGEHVEVCTVDQEADDWYELLTGHKFTSPQVGDDIGPEDSIRYFSISNYRKEETPNLVEFNPEKDNNLVFCGAKKYKTLLTVWEVKPGVGPISGPVYISGSRAKKLIRMLTGHRYKMHNED